MRTHTKDTQLTMTPSRALQILKEGNDRFLGNLKANRNLLEQVNDTRGGQWPFATIFSCIDSRTSAELIFDQGLGDIFSIRLAGNVLSDMVLGSMEFACKLAGSRLLVVLGHTSCGAVKGACDNVQLGNLSTLLNLIQPSIYFERSTEDRTSSNSEFVDRVARDPGPSLRGRRHRTQPRPEGHDRGLRDRSHRRDVRCRDRRRHVHRRDLDVRLGPTLLRRLQGPRPERPCRRHEPGTRWECC